MNSKKSQLFLIIFFLIRPSLFGNINNLKGTYSILKDEYKHLSVINGAIADKQKFIMRLYDYGAAKDKKNKNGQVVPELRGAPAIVKLVHAFYHRPPETVGVSNFVLTEKLKEKDRQSLIAEFAKIISSLEMISKEMENKKRLTPTLEAKSRDIKISLIPGIKTFFSIYESLKQEYRSKNKKIASIFPKKATLTILLSVVWRLCRDDKKLLAIFYKELDKKISTAKFDQLKLDKNKYELELEKVDKEIQEIERDIEQLEKEELKKKIKQKKKKVTKLKKFKPKLNNRIKELTKKIKNEIESEEKSIFNKEIDWDKWEQDAFDSKLIESYKKRALELNSDSDIKDIINNFEELVYVVLLPGEYPDIATYKTINLHWNEQEPDDEFDFPDCMDNTFRNLVNIFVYNSKSNKFSINTLVQRLQDNGEVKPNKKLIKFYKTIISNKEGYLEVDFSNATSINEYKVHSYWVSVISNIPFVTYNRRESDSNKEARFTSVGYIHVPEVINKAFYEEVKDGYYKKASKNRKYILSNKKDNLYEILPSLRNIIIVFNYLFGLNLFKDEKGSTENQKIARAFEKNDFVKHYFPMLCDRLKIKFNGWNEKKVRKKLPIKADEIDNIDYTDTPILTNLSFDRKIQKNEFELYTENYKHGELRFLDELEKKDRWDWTLNYIDINGKFSSLYILPYLACSLVPYDAIEKFKQLTEQQISEVLFWLPINNSDYVTDFVLKIDFNLKNYSLKLLLHLIGKILDKQESFINNTLLYKFLVEKGQSIGEAIKFAEKGIRSEDVIKVAGSLSLWKSLIKKKHGFAEAIKSAKKVVNNENNAIRNKGFSLWKALVNQGQGLSEAINAAKYGIISEEKNSRKAALELSEAIFDNASFIDKDLFEKIIGFNKTIPIVKNLLNKDDKQIKQKGLDLLYVVLQNVLENKNEQQTIQIIDLLMDLFSNNDYLSNKERRKKERMRFKKMIFLSDLHDESTEVEKKLVEFHENTKL